MTRLVTMYMHSWCRPQRQGGGEGCLWYVRWVVRVSSEVNVLLVGLCREGGGGNRVVYTVESIHTYNMR